jgi:fatty acid desaturase
LTGESALMAEPARSKSPKTEQFPFAKASALVRELMKPNPLIYWADFLLSAAIGWGSFYAVVRMHHMIVAEVLLSIVTVLALYRAVIFTHELAHLKKGTFGLFRWVWNLTCGFPLMVPSFIYQGVHIDHHRKDIYGTDEDGEYLAFATNPPREIIAYLAQSFVLPLVLFGRFVFLTPVSYFFPGIRKWAWKHASSMKIDMSYVREPETVRDDPTWRIQEFATFFYGATVVVLIAVGVVRLDALLLYWVVGASIIFLNAIRTLAAHAYRNPVGRSMNLTDQLLDSVTIPGNRVFTALWAPVGLRYHSTHHLFANLPYHNLGKAHRRLVADLADNEIYLKTLRPSLFEALRRLWLKAREARTQNAAAESPQTS